ncbi:hypothetical protein AMR42_18550 [Limnothrix sp. PR1529]|uniref:hypothetical protein n=1 Tax=Limnothrix sp. PR1529 TaxID=1704291 RepID=UPI00081D37D0|nr:hypothetical protein [Limnothrix sp. PR1529]OCQ96247.1 hypothetical protein BCR12_14335 [Limnothrix sp. P13C2]PIB03687.1 hypothetical protein AMR42_18550 [Limnothrix sp. PR1529]
MAEKPEKADWYCFYPTPEQELRMQAWDERQERMEYAQTFSMLAELCNFQNAKGQSWPQNFFKTVAIDFDAGYSSLRD